MVLFAVQPEHTVAPYSFHYYYLFYSMCALLRIYPLNRCLGHKTYTWYPILVNGVGTLLAEPSIHLMFKAYCISPVRWSEWKLQGSKVNIYYWWWQKSACMLCTPPPPHCVHWRFWHMMEVRVSEIEYCAPQVSVWLNEWHTMVPSYLEGGEFLNKFFWVLERPSPQPYLWNSPSAGYSYFIQIENHFNNTYHQIQSSIPSSFTKIRFPMILFLHQQQYMSSLPTKWWNHGVVMKKSHTGALSGAARVIKEDWWRLVIPPRLQATGRKKRHLRSSTSAAFLL